MLIAQLGHITEIAAGDWLKPNTRSPDRADSAAWVSEVLDEPHTRALLESLLAAARTREPGCARGVSVTRDAPVSRTLPWCGSGQG